MARFWVYIGDKVQGPVDIPSLRKVPGFNLLSQVCQEGEQTWRMADEVIEIKSYFISPPRPNSFAIDAGNAAPKLDLESKPAFDDMTLPEPNMSWQSGTSKPKSGDPNLEIILANEPAKKEPVSAGPAGSAALRAVCEVCGYKNPRDVAVCMKCGEKLPLTLPSPQGEGKRNLGGTSLPTPTPAPQAAPAPMATSPAPAPAHVDPVPNTMVEISLPKLLMGCAVACAIAGSAFWGYRSWRKHHRPKTPAPAAPVIRMTAKPVKKISRRPAHRYTGYTTTLPGVSKEASPKVSAPRKQKADATDGETEPKAEAAAYRVVPAAAPLKHRFSSPVNSPYAVKRRADKGLWNAQEDHAIQQVQRNRIYGGQRTVERNVEILMQVLRDREYTTAFESGRRIHLYNDVDWSAELKDGPVYEVRLTFSGGRETDGSPKKPLHFAFLSDLERGTVEPGGQDQIRSNTLHAFFDESRIAPEDRRAIAKDTEELVLAAQPDASPLALDTVVRQFAKVYTTAALSRVADAYDLTLVKKRLAHDTRLGMDDPIAPKQEGAREVKEAKEAPEPTMFGGQVVQPLKSGDQTKPRASATNEKTAESSRATALSSKAPVEFRMEQGAGRERSFIVRAASSASPNRLWETVTGYDRLKQFMPDMLASEREGQDGAAIIVHAVCITRYLVFMFKVNLHLRVIEHAREHTIEFERIAGDFENFRGAFEIVTDPATRESQMTLRLTLKPSAFTMDGKLESMAKRILIPQMNAIRAKAESN